MSNTSYLAVLNCWIVDLFLHYEQLNDDDDDDDDDDNDDDDDDKCIAKNLCCIADSEMLDLDFSRFSRSSLPPAIRDPSLSPSIFGKLLKTYLFV